MSILVISDTEKMEFINMVAHEWENQETNEHQAVLIIRAILDASADMTPFIRWLNEKRLE